MFEAVDNIIRREAQQDLWCRTCRRRQDKGTEVIAFAPTYYLCLDCAVIVANVALYDKTSETEP